MFTIYILGGLKKSGGGIEKNLMHMLEYRVYFVDEAFFFVAI